MVTFLAGFAIGCAVTLLLFAGLAIYIGDAVMQDVTWPEGTKHGEAETSE